MPFRVGAHRHRHKENRSERRAGRAALNIVSSPSRLLQEDDYRMAASGGSTLEQVVKISPAGGLPCLAKAISGLVVTAGTLILLGWVLDVPFLIRLAPTAVAMNPMTALCFILVGIALWCRSRRVDTRIGRQRAVRAFRSPLPWGLIFAALVAVFGGLKLGDYVGLWRVPVDHLLFASKVTMAGAYPPNEMAPNTALSFFFCGLALLVMDAETRRQVWPAQPLIIAVGLIALLALIGYTYRVLVLYRVGGAVPMSLDTAIAFMLFCLGFLAARPNRGLMSFLTSRTAGGAMVRRLLPVAILIPRAVGGLLLLGEQAGYYGWESTLSMFAVASIVIFTEMIWWNTRLLYRTDLERLQTERRLAAQHYCTRVLAEARSAAEALPRLLQAVCETLGWPLATLWKVDKEANALRCVELWSAADPALRQFEEVTRKTVHRKGAGLPGRTWATAEGLRLQPLLQEPGDPRLQAAAAAGLRSAWAVPIWIGQEVYGVLEFFSRTEELRPEPLLEMLSVLGTQAGLFIERVRAEEQLRQTSTNLERSNTDLQQFAYLASHDLFEPLRMITSYLQILEQRYGKALDKQAHEFIGFALDGARRMQALINDLLAYARVDIRGLPFEPTATEDVFAAALTNLKVAIDENKAVVSHEPLPTVRADAVQLTQVFQNLVGNAIKFHGPAPPCIDVGAVRRDGEWLFHVRDNGIGIDPKNFERIFVIFQRLHTRQEYAGTGMGLAICKKIVERHGGCMWVESSPGRGSTFFFTLPATDGDHGTMAKSETASEASENA